MDSYKVFRDPEHGKGEWWLKGELNILLNSSYEMRNKWLDIVTIGEKHFIAEQRNYANAKTCYFPISKEKSEKLIKIHDNEGYYEYSKACDNIICRFY